MSMRYIWLTTPTVTTVPSNSHVRLGNPGASARMPPPAGSLSPGAGGTGTRRSPQAPSAALPSDRPPVNRYSGPKPNRVSRYSPAGGPITHAAENTDRIHVVNAVTGRPRALANSLAYANTCAKPRPLTLRN